MNEELSEDRLRSHVWQLAAEIGERNVFRPSALHAAEEYVREVWHDQSYHVHAQECTAFGVRSANLEATRPGSGRKDEIILVGAHYDSVEGSPGANDNGSGVAVLLELSRRFASVDCSRTVRFVAFTNEEPPFFLSRQQGSMIYASAARRRGNDIRLMIALETLGYYRNEPHSQRYPPLFGLCYPDRANFVGFVSNLRSRGQMRRLAAAFRASSDFPLEYVATFAFIPGVAWSDHFAFWLRRYHALMVTDTAFYRYPWYHTAEDTPEKLDYASLARVTEGLFRAIRRLANVMV
jgi:Zn-dependent M28 family amino/carboxypeptidase